MLIDQSEFGLLNRLLEQVYPLSFLSCLEKVALLLPIALEQIAQVAVGLHTSSIRNRLINMV